MTVKKMSVNVAKVSKKSRLPVSSLLPRIAIYSAVMAGIIACFYDFKLNIIAPSSYKTPYEGPQSTGVINKAQLHYYAEYGQFSDSIAKLGLGRKEHTKNYRYTIVSSMGPVQTRHNYREPAQFESAIAIAKPTETNPGEKSYTGVVFAYKEKGSNLIRTISAICQSDRENASYAETWSPPTFDGKEIHCQPGTTLWPRKFTASPEQG